MAAGPGLTKSGGTNRECTPGQHESSGSPVVTACPAFCAVVEEEAAHTPDTLHMASEANINAAMNRFFIPGSL
jgi:hypothetical protein